MLDPRCILSLILLLIFIEGCAVHNPMSEMVMFNKKTSLDGRKYSARYSHALISINKEMYDKQSVLDYTYATYPVEEEYTYSYDRVPVITTHAIFMSDATDDFAVSVALGNVLGADMTIKLLNTTYFTGVLSIGSGIQTKIMLQQRILDGNPSGLSLGATFGINSHTVEISGLDCGFCFASKSFETKTAGLRVLFTSSPITDYGTSRPFFYLTGSANYDFDLDVFYPRLGFSLGIY